MAGVILISESLRGTHRPPFPVMQLSTRGSAGFYLSNSTGNYPVRSDILRFIEANNPKVVLIGTDFDHTGTKIGTILRNQIKEFAEKNGKDIEVIRTAFTNKGYMKVGRFYNEREMNACKEYDRMNAEVRAFFREKHSDKPPTSLSKAIATARAYSLLKEGGNVAVKQGKTATVTAVVKGMLGGMTASGVMSRLNKAYAMGVIEYPRVDVDYYADSYPYDVYAHPPLTSMGYEDEIVSPIEEDALPLTINTVLLALSDERLVTPSMLDRTDEHLRAVFDENGRPKDGFENYIKDCQAIEREYVKEYQKTLKAMSPRSPIYRVRNPKKKQEEALLEYLKKVKERAEELFEKEQPQNLQVFTEEENTMEAPEDRPFFQPDQHRENSRSRRLM